MLLFCSEAYHPRLNEEKKRRRRREADAAADSGAHEIDKVQMFRSLEVLMTEEGGEKSKLVCTVQDLLLAVWCVNELFLDFKWFYPQWLL